MIEPSVANETMLQLASCNSLDSGLSHITASKLNCYKVAICLFAKAFVPFQDPTRVCIPTQMVTDK